MKKYILLIALSIGCLQLSAQVWLEASLIHSTPQNDWFESGEDFFLGDGKGNTLIFPNTELFRQLTRPSIGLGLSVRYLKNGLVSGLSFSYIAYREEIDLLQLSNLKVGPFMEYYFGEEGKMQAFVGAEFALQQTRVKFNQEVLETSKIADTYVGFGPRAGVLIPVNKRWNGRLGATYILGDTIFTLNFFAGISIGLGDF